jgi:hypothetical protein
MVKRNLTEKQQMVLDVLFDEAGGDLNLAVKLAGYAETTHASQVVGAIEEEILEATRKYFSRIAPRAAVAISGILVTPTDLGNKEKLAAAKDLLDRAGLVKTDKIQVESSGGIFILPPKNDNAEED